jgi:hypothetical protein
VCREAAAFEELMYDWDSAFEAFCEDTEKAVEMARLADEGFRQHGRGERLLAGSSHSPEPRASLPDGC